MTHELDMRQDGIVRLAFIGDINKADTNAFVQDIQPYLDALAKGDSLNIGFFDSEVQAVAWITNSDK